jgi:hypothetical protein
VAGAAGGVDAGAGIVDEVSLLRCIGSRLGTPREKGLGCCGSISFFGVLRLRLSQKRDKLRSG